MCITFFVYNQYKNRYLIAIFVLWTVQDLNLWPLQCECSALPLS